MNKAAMLVDLGICIGCESCTVACTLNRGLPVEEGRVVWTRIRSFETGTFPQVSVISTKRQCMHCEEPACVSACPVGALQKTASGPVVYDASKCIGCRYCMTACPFEVPKLNWDNLLPSIQKCNFCVDRQAAGLQPACVTDCPSGALMFGERDALLVEAKTRIQKSNGKYVNYVYGEHEVGGTSWLYISTQPFEKLGFPAVGTEPVTKVSEQVVSMVPAGVGVLAVALSGAYWFFDRRERLKKKAPATQPEEKEE